MGCECESGEGTLILCLEEKKKQGRRAFPRSRKGKGSAAIALKKKEGREIEESPISPFLRKKKNQLLCLLGRKKREALDAR